MKRFLWGFITAPIIFILYYLFGPKTAFIVSIIFFLGVGIAHGALYKSEKLELETNTQDIITIGHKTIQDAKMAIILGADINILNTKNKKNHGNLLKYIYENPGDQIGGTYKAYLLLTCGIQIFNTHTKTEHDTLHLVSRKPNLNYTRALLHMGADPNKKLLTSRVGVACENNKLTLELLILFLEFGADLNIQYKHKTIIDKILSKRAPDIHLYLLERGLITRDNGSGILHTCLDYYADIFEKLQYQYHPGKAFWILVQEEFPNVNKYDLFK